MFPVAMQPIATDTGQSKQCFTQVTWAKAPRLWSGLVAPAGGTQLSATLSLGYHYALFGV